MNHSKPTETEISKLLKAIRTVETGGEPNPTYAVGRYQEIGPFQITYAYFEDSGIKGTWTQNCLYVDRSIKVMLAYWNRYAKLHTLEEYARLHNGGPNGMNNRNTLEYWHKVKAEMEAEQ
jgi:hypothetical protein